MIAAPIRFNLDTVSPRRKKASTADPTGSPRISTDTFAAGRTRKAQLKVECPINCGTSARSTKYPYVDVWKPTSGVCVTAHKARTTRAAVP